MKQKHFLTGQTFSYLFVVSQLSVKKHNKIQWECLCKCGTTIVVDTGSLISKNTTSCGCRHKEIVKQTKTKHSKTKTRAYFSWRHLLKRKNVGWNTFEEFYSDMGDPPTDLQLCRYDKEKPFTKENCFWGIGPHFNKKQTKESFWSKINVLDKASCWEIKKKPNRHFDYGAFKYDGKTYLGHRLAWKLTYGDVPNGLCVLHSCDNPKCCNPHHLFLGTKQDNYDDMKNKGRAYNDRGFLCRSIPRS